MKSLKIQHVDTVDQKQQLYVRFVADTGKQQLRRCILCVHLQNILRRQKTVEKAICKATVQKFGFSLPLNQNV